MMLTRDFLRSPDLIERVKKHLLDGEKEPSGECYTLENRLLLDRFALDYADIPEEYLIEMIGRMVKRGIILASAPQLGKRFVLDCGVHEESTNIMGERVMNFRATVMPTKDYRVYVPVMDRAELPVGSKPCKFCGGYTHDDKRGNCLACGAPRGWR